MIVDDGQRGIEIQNPRTIKLGHEQVIGSDDLFMETLSPSFLSHRAICPSSIVGESLGIITLLAIQRSLA